MSVNWNTGFKTGILQILLNEWQFREPAYTWRLDRGGGMHLVKTIMNVCLEDGGLFCQLSIVCQVIVFETVRLMAHFLTLAVSICIVKV